MSLTDVLGMPLSEALDILRSMGYAPEVKMTQASKQQRSGGSLRVVRVSPNEITVSAFLCDWPNQ